MNYDINTKGLAFKEQFRDAKEPTYSHKVYRLLMDLDMDAAILVAVALRKMVREGRHAEISNRDMEDLTRISGYLDTTIETITKVL